MTDHLKQMERRQADWQARRQEELSAPDSWLGLIALIWLEPGSNSVGEFPRLHGGLTQRPAIAGTPGRCRYGGHLDAGGGNR